MPSQAHSPNPYSNQIINTRSDRELRSSHSHSKIINPQKIYIGGLPEITRSEDLQDCFSQLGKILTIELKTGYGFVEFDNPQSAADAVTKYHEGHFLGAQIKVELSHGGSRPRHIAVAANPEACYSCGHAGHRARDCQEADPTLQRRPIRTRSRSPLPIRDDLNIRHTRDHYDPPPREDPRQYPERLRPSDPLLNHRERDRLPPVIEPRRDDRREIRRDDRLDERRDDRRLERRLDRRDDRLDERRVMIGVLNGEMIGVTIGVTTGVTNGQMVDGSIDVTMTATAKNLHLAISEIVSIRVVCLSLATLVRSMFQHRLLHFLQSMMIIFVKTIIQELLVLALMLTYLHLEIHMRVARLVILPVTLSLSTQIQVLRLA
ncbi:hypothetical protein DFH28DRAFT_514641 [Melampsora americana]|nr:hypothetical protein DFH28DRAFT_514641 [Melampsora americana]